MFNAGLERWAHPDFWSARQKPTEPVELDADHPLARNPLFVVPFTEYGGAPRSIAGVFQGDLVKVGTAGGTIAPGDAAFEGGIAGDFPASGDDWQIPAGAADYLPTGQITYAIVRQKNSTSITNAPSFGYRLNPNVLTNRAGGHYPYSDGTVYWDFGGNSGANRLTWAGYTAGTGLEVWVFVAGSRGSAIYYNGLQKASQGTGITRTQAADIIGLNTGNANATSDPNRLLLFAAFDAQWTTEDVREFYNALWALFGPSAWVRMLGHPAAAAATGGPFPFFTARPMTGGMIAMG